MPSPSNIANISIVASSRTPTAANFGVPLLFGYHTAWVDLRRVYTDLDGMIDDGFTAGHPLYRMAQALLAQDPSVESFIVGRATTAASWAGELVITDATEGDQIRFTVVLADGTETDVTYTIPAAATTSTVATAVEALIEALTGLNSTVSTTTISITAATAGDVFYFKPQSGDAKIRGALFRETTADPNYSTQLATLRGVDDSWYSVTIDLRSQAAITDVAAYIETLPKIAVLDISDSRESETGTAVVGPAMNAAGYDRTSLWYTRGGESLAAGIVGAMLATNPGSATWVFKQVSGVTSDNLTDTDVANLTAAYLNYYTEIAGLNVTQNGFAASGEFIDTTIGIDWLSARIQERIVALLANAPKVPYTDAGLDLLAGEVRSQCEEGSSESYPLLVRESIVVTVVPVASQASGDRAARIVRNIRFSATLQGAVHKVYVRGTVSV